MAETERDYDAMLGSLREMVLGDLGPVEVFVVDQTEARLREVLIEDGELTEDARWVLAKVLKLFFVLDIDNRQRHKRCEALMDDDEGPCPGHLTDTYMDWALHSTGLVQMLVNDHDKQEAHP